MKELRKTISFFNKIKWLGLVFGAFMCLYIEPLLGSIWAMTLGTIAGVAFLYICENEKKRLIGDHVAKDLKEALCKGGYKDTVFEMKHMRPGMIIRIYVINSGKNTIYCNGIIVRQIQRSWYKDKIWITQLVGVRNEEEIGTARDTLDDELIEDIRRMRDEARRK
ncbi:MAG: hypothetical protein IKW01_02065 [Firmicutes bacterium]|nr:hypothetical protein [Bacillota bacterium]